MNLSFLEHIDRHPGQLIAHSTLVLGLTSLPTAEMILRFFQIAAAAGTALLVFTSVYRKWFGKKKMRYRIELLLIDDDPADQQLFARAFTLAGCHVAVAGSFPEALAVMRQPRKIDLILLDANMPGEETRVMFRKIKTERPTTPCALFSGILAPAMVAEVSQIAPGTALFLKESATQEFAANIIETLKIGRPI